jgi:cytochrome c oxidase subunit 2
VQSNELVLPVDRPVHFQIHAKDVLHSFWVPAFRMKQDAVPGITTTTRVTPDREGTYEVVCAELCGIGHATMRQQVRVVPTAEFDDWVKDRGEGGAAPEEGESPMAAGREIFTSAGCNACHTLADADATGEVGPNLDELPAVAGEREKGTRAEDYVHQSIVDPPAFVVKGYSGDTMPGNFGDQLTPEEIDTLVQYLLGESKTEKSK